MSNSRPRRRRRRSGAWILALAFAAALLPWTGGLVWFASILPKPGGDAAAGGTDAVVVLTGGPRRLAEGLRLLAAGRAGKLFVSGVHRGVDVAELLRVAQRAPEDVACCIALGYAAGNTAGNAEETAAWMAGEGFRSLRLVTASYHMPRSLLEFRAAMPDTRIVVHPVFPERFKQARWWMRPGSAALIAGEYTKYVAALARLLLRWPR